MKDYDPKHGPSVEISTQAAAEQHWQALEKQDLPQRSVLLFADRLSEELHLGPMLSTGLVMAVQVSGDSAEDGHPLDFSFVQKLRQQCIAHDVPFHFAGTGAHFRMNGRMYHIPQRLQAVQAAKAEMEYFPLCLAINPPLCLPEGAAAAQRKDAAEEASAGGTAQPMLMHLHYPIEIADDDDYPGASPEEIAELEENERRRKAERPVQFQQEALQFLPTDL